MPSSCASWRRFLPCSLVLSALAAGPLRAQQAEHPGQAVPAPAELTGEAAQLTGEAVEITADKPVGSERAKAAQSTVVDTAQFGGEVRSVSELLLAAPGVSVHALGGPGQATTLSLRGASADQSLVLLDGMALSGPGGGAVDLSTLPASLLERLVVSRGVLGAQLGAGALGGAVELFPRTARDRLSGGAQLSYGSFGSAQASLDVATPLGEDGSVLGAVELDRTVGDFDYARQLTPELPGSPLYGFSRRNADALRGSLLVRASERVTPSVELDGLVQASAGERGLPGPSSSETPRSREVDRGGLAGVRLRGIAGVTTWSVRAHGRLDSIELRGVQVFGDCPDLALGCPRQEQRAGALRLELEGSAPLGSAQRATLSLEGGEDEARGATGLHRRAAFSLALADELRLPRGFSLHPALRLDSIGTLLGLSPALAALWRPAPASPLELRAGAGLSFRAPTFSELYLERGGLAANPDLLPERAFSADLGAAFRTAALTLAGSIFWSSYRDLILYELFPPARVKPFNTGSARIAGVELQAVLALPFGCFAEGSYSFLDARNLRAGDQGGNQLPYRPPHRLFLRLARKGDRLEGYAETSFTSRMPRNQFGSAFLPAQLLFNAGAGFRALGPLWLDLEAKNLLDDRTLEDLFQYPLPGLSIAVIARARL